MVTPSIVLTDCVEAELAVVVIIGGRSLVSEVVVEVMVGIPVVDPGLAVVVEIADGSLMLDPVFDVVEELSVPDTVSDDDEPVGIVPFVGVFVVGIEVSVEVVSVVDAELLFVLTVLAVEIELPEEIIPVVETEPFNGGVNEGVVAVEILLPVLVVGTEVFVETVLAVDIEVEPEPIEVAMVVPLEPALV